MTPNEQRLLDFANEINLALRGEYIDSAEEQEMMDKTVGWVNQFLPELENEALWNFSRENDSVIGVAQASPSYQIDDDIRIIVASEYRDLTIRHDGAVISTFKVVNPNQIYDPSDYYTGDRVMQSGRNLVFSRTLNDTEQGGDIVADIINFIPRLSRQDVEMLDIVEPLQLVVLGVLKNMVLPGITDRGLSPTFTQKYADLLGKAKEANDATTAANRIVQDDFGWVRGVY